MLCVCVVDVIDVVFSVCRGAHLTLYQRISLTS